MYRNLAAHPRNMWSSLHTLLHNTRQIYHMQQLDEYYVVLGILLVWQY